MKAGFTILLVSVLSALCFAEQVRTRTVAGRVIDYQARPVEDALVVCYEIHYEHHHSFFPLGQRSYKPLGRASTNSDGRFSLLVEKETSRLYLVAGKQSLALGWKKLYRGSESIIRLGKPSLFKGTVVDEAGFPVPGAKIRICLKNRMMTTDWGMAPLIPEGWFTTQTDERGQFLFDNVPTGATADFGVEAPGKALVWTICDFGLMEGEQYAAGRTDIRIVLPHEARIKGQVVNERTGQALAGVRIMAKPAGHVRWKYHQNQVYSDPNGRFEFIGLVPDTYLLCAISPKEGAGNLTVTLASGQAVNDVRIPVTGIPLEVVVKDLQEGDPIENANVVVTQKATTSECTVFDQTATTDPNGRASLCVPLGKCEVQAMKSDHGITFQPRLVQIDPGQLPRQELFLPRTACILSGEVVDEQGNMLSGASVLEFNCGLHLSTFTDVNGRFKMSYHSGRPPSRVSILARHSPSGLAGTGVIQYSGESGRFDGRIIAIPAYTLIGRVIDPNGRSIPAANLKLLLAVGEGSTLQVMGWHSRPVAEATTDANGVYCIRSVPPPGNRPKDAYAIVAYAEGFGITMISQIPFGDDMAKPVHLEPIILRPADQSISGIVEDANEQSIAGAVVKVYGPRLGSGYGPQLCRKALTDTQGRFRIAGVCEEPLVIYAMSPWGLKHSGVTSAYGGNENIKAVLRQRLQFTPSLIGKTLPELKDLGINLSPANANDKAIVVCFFDMNQRPSRNCLRQLST
ncbi:MAG: carboxypeptidase regulatory-like domain-containing protein, partial [Planctomycetota bacterium]